MQLSQFFKRFGKKQDGTAAVEFSLIAILMLVILFAMIQFGAMFYHYNVMQNAARDGARRLAVDNDIYPGVAAGAGSLCSGTIAGSVEEYVCNIMQLPAEARVAACITEDVADARFDAEVVVSAPMDDVSLIDLLGVGAGRDLRAVAVMRVENGKDPDPAAFPMCPTSIPPLT